jgi:succinoglycan biosynthesis transport protein ExoP
MNKARPKNQSDTDMPKITMRDVLAPLFRHRRIVIFTFCMVAILGTLVAWLWAPHYHVAQMQILVEQNRSDPTVTSAQNSTVANSKLVTTDQIASEMALLQGLDMLRTVATTCGLADKPGLTDFLLPKDPEQRRAIKLEKAAVGLQKGISVEQEKAADIINVKYGSTADPHVPACILQTLSKLYLAKHLQLRRPAGSSDFFAEQTVQARHALDDSETRLADFSREAGVAAPDVLRTDMAQEVASATLSLSQAQQAIAADEQKIKNIDAQLATTPARISTEEVSDSASGLLQQLQSALLAAQQKRAQLLVKYDANFPLVQEANREIADTEAAIAKAQNMNFVNKTTSVDPTYEYLRQDMAKTQADLAAQKAIASTLASTIRNMHVQMVDLDNKAVKQAALIRETKANEANYLLYLSKREQERTSDALDKNRIADVEIAVPPVVPLLPARGPFLVMLVSFVLATILAIAAGYVAEFADVSFRTPGEVSETLSMPVLAVFPRKAA